MKKDKLKFRQILKLTITISANLGNYLAKVTSIAYQEGVAKGEFHPNFKYKNNIQISLFQEYCGNL